jgi:hypothetical protein
MLSWYFVYFKTSLLKSKEILQILFNKHDHEIVAKLCILTFAECISHSASLRLPVVWLSLELLIAAIVY